MANRWRKVQTVTDFIFLESRITADSDSNHKSKRCLLWEKSYDKPRQHIKKQRHHFADKGLSSQSYSFSSSHVQIWELDHKEGWAMRNWCLQIVVLDKTLESSLDSKEVKQVNPKGNQLLVFIGRNDAESEAPIFGCLMRRGDSLEKILKLGKNKGRRRRGWQRMRCWMASLNQWTWAWANPGR